MGLNDPQWGRKKGNSGPPDLDQLWRNFNKKLNNLFKRKGGGGNGSGGGEPGDGGPKRYGGSIGLLVGLLLLLWIGSGFYIVNEGQRGIVFDSANTWRVHRRACAGTCHIRSRWWNR